MTIIFSSRFSQYSAATIFTLALAACGGGGSDTPIQTTAPTTTFPVASAMASFASDASLKTFTVTGTGTSNGQTIAFTGNGNVSATFGTGTFEGAAAQVKILKTTATLTAQGTSVPVVDAAVAFYDSNFQVLGTSTASSYCVSSGSAGFPATAKVGDAGAWYSATCYTNSTKSVRTSTSTLSFVVEPLTATSAILRVTQKSAPLTGAAFTQDLTYTITTAGTITARETPFSITSGGVTVSLVFKFL